MKQLKRVAFN